MSLRIVLKGHSGSIYKEANAGGAITPGHLIKVNSSGNAVVQSDSARVQAAVAIENHWTGGGIDTAYAANDQVCYQVLQPGAEWNALVAAAAPAITNGDWLESAGDGTVRKTATQANAMAIARATVDNSGGGSAVRIRAEVIL
jgi:hypothetical protein